MRTRASGSRHGSGSRRWTTAGRSRRCRPAYSLERSSGSARRRTSRSWRRRVSRCSHRPACRAQTPAAHFVTRSGYTLIISGNHHITASRIVHHPTGSLRRGRTLTSTRGTYSLMAPGGTRPIRSLARVCRHTQALISLQSSFNQASDESPHGTTTRGPTR